MGFRERKMESYPENGKCTERSQTNLLNFRQDEYPIFILPDVCRYRILNNKK